MTFNDTQIPSNCKFTPNMDIKTWKPGVALMFESWSKSVTIHTFNDVVNGRFEDASEYMDEEQRQEWVGKTAEELAKNNFDSAWYAAGKTIPSDYEAHVVTWDNAIFDTTDMTIVVDPNTKEILLATMHSD